MEVHLMNIIFLVCSGLSQTINRLFTTFTTYVKENIHSEYM